MMLFSYDRGGGISMLVGRRERVCLLIQMGLYIDGVM